MTPTDTHLALLRLIPAEDQMPLSAGGEDAHEAALKLLLAACEEAP